MSNVDVEQELIRMELTKLGVSEATLDSITIVDPKMWWSAITMAKEGSRLVLDEMLSTAPKPKQPATSDRQEVILITEATDDTTVKRMKAAAEAKRDKKFDKSGTTEFVLDEVTLYSVSGVGVGKYGVWVKVLRDGEKETFLPASLVKDATKDGIEFVFQGTYRTLFAGEKDVGKPNPKKIWVTERVN